MNGIYSRDGSAAFNQKLHLTLVNIADDVERALEGNLVSLVLGGGYGRGEGGVVLRHGQEKPYNDLDFTLIVIRKLGLPLDRLADISHSFAKSLGIHVDFSRPLTLRDVEHWPCWLMWYDLLNGHVVLKGFPDVLTKHAPQSLQTPLPAIEGTRLLLNRGAGLLWALRVSRRIEEPPDEDFVRRNYYKCSLALGDALLIAYKRYTTQYTGRDGLLSDLELDEPSVAALQLQNMYSEALQFKFRPDSVSSDTKREADLKVLAEVWGSVFLQVERMRTGLSWGSLEEYTRWKGIREDDQHAISLIPRNLVRNLQAGRMSWRYPREPLYRLLPVLLGLVNNQVTDWSNASARFLKVWDRFN